MENYRRNLISILFNDLDNRTEYAILHHAQDIYEEGGDIDFIVNFSHESMNAFVKSFCENHHLYLAHHFLIDRGIYRYSILFYSHDNLERIDLDCFCFNGRNKNLLITNGKNLLKNRILKSYGDYHIYHLSGKDEALHYIKKKAFKKESISKYISYLIQLDDNINFEFIKNSYEFWLVYFKTPKYKIKLINSFFLRFWYRLSFKSSLTICFLGPDGSGKSTIISSIQNQSILINDFYFHLKPIKKTKKNIDIENPHKSEPYSEVKSYVKLIYFLYQYIFGWLKNVLPLKLKPSLIVFDRYFDDLLVDHYRYRYGGKKSIIYFIRKLIPKPDLYFILIAEKEVIYKRKQEVSLLELDRQIQLYKDLTKKSHYFKVNVDDDITSIQKYVCHKILEEMHARY